MPVRLVVGRPDGTNGVASGELELGAGLKLWHSAWRGVVLARPAYRPLCDAMWACRGEVADALGSLHMEDPEVRAAECGSLAV